MTTQHFDDQASTARLSGQPAQACLPAAGKAIHQWLHQPGKAGRFGLILAAAKVFLGRRRPSAKAVAAGVGVAAVVGTALWAASRQRR